MIKLVLILLSPVLVKSSIVRSDGTPPVCLSETNNACQEELKQKNETLIEITNTYYPPLTDSLKNYTEQCRNVMECASGLECFQGKSQREIFETSCDMVGSRWYYFDSCFFRILLKIYSNDHNCTAGFSFENLFTADTIFKKEKQCVLNIGLGVCKTEFFNYLQNNYDELIELYTNRPTSDIDLWDHPSEKFYMLHCDVLRTDFEQKSKNISILSVNQENADVQKVSVIGQSAQKCIQKSLIIHGNDKYYKIFKNMHAFVAVMSNIFKHRPRLLEYPCLSSVSWFTVYYEVCECMDVGDAKKCVWSFITLHCQKEMMTDFKNQTVTLTPRNESPICRSETNNACQEEMKKKNETLERIYHIHHPLTELFNIYTDQCRNVMECASGLECFKGKSQREIFETSCDNVRSGWYSFDFCIYHILEKIYSNDHNCTAGFSFENFFTADTIFKKEKQCILNIGQDICKTDDFNFLLNNYDELIELYTNKPTSDEDGWDHPSEKFYRMHCDVLGSDFVHKLYNITTLSINQENSDVQKVLETAQMAHKCLQKSLVVRFDNYYSQLVRNIQAFVAVLTNIFKHRPRLLECVFLDFYRLEVFRGVMDCMDVGDAKKCILAFLHLRCPNEVLAHLKNPTENLFTADTIFKKEKQCVLNIGQGVCKTDDFNFLQNNYDDLIELYTKNPTSDNDQWDHPSEKFYRMHCDALQDDFVQKSLGIMITSVNQKNADVQKVVEIGQSAQNVQPFVAVMTDIFKRRPRLLEYRCLSSFGWIDFFDGAMECMNGGDTKKCVLSLIRKYCQDEILADFEDLTVTMPPSKRSNECASGLECFKGKSQREIIETSCDDVGTLQYSIDDCLRNILKKIYSNDHNCTAGFSFENLFTADTIFKKEKQCILNIGQGVCKTDDFDFLQNNYDELIELYTTAQLRILISGIIPVKNSTECIAMFCTTILYRNQKILVYYPSTRKMLMFKKLLKLLKLLR
ncbi:hypothetical protein GCK72_016726 [Caenorhabditis remanei]|uniref:T20D4.11-like domain-containing protein n=1 Tax=Caenorhabditis remanei TaxID=31234 RepID=A0A6A5G6R8_CAERE|nr:hypothetical protein GCK72_016726 [Caenorhabditis remanei]KAF1750179.1 hypothetical protein GCK72_016726 [Caenorhabditis remanei]